MTARVITDPSALGWVLDPDTGRWEWSGSGDGGGSGGGGGAWELLEVFDITGATAIDYPDCGKEYSAYKLECSHLFVSSAPFNLYSYLYINGSLSNGGTGQNVYDRSVFDPLDSSQSFSGDSFFQHVDQLGSQKTGLYSFEIVYSGFTLDEEPNRESRSPALISSTVNFDADQRRQVTVGKARLEPENAEFTGFQLFVRGHDRGKVYLSGLRN